MSASEGIQTLVGLDITELSDGAQVGMGSYSPRFRAHESSNSFLAIVEPIALDVLLGPGGGDPRDRVLCLEMPTQYVGRAITPIGFFGPLRGLLFVDMGGAHYIDQGFKLFSSERRLSSLGARCGPGGNAPCVSEGWGLAGFDPETGARGPVASYGIGLTFNFFGMPMNINWSKLTDFATTVEGWKTDFWIGFNF